MSSAISIAVGGLQAASRQFDSAARSVVSSGIAGQIGGAETEKSASPGNSAGQQTGTLSGTGLSPTAPIFEAPDLAAGIVDMKLAEISYKAQIDVISVASRMREEAIDLVA